MKLELRDAMLLALCLALVGDVRAANAQADRSFTVPTPPAEDPRDAGYRAWRDANLPTAKDPVMLASQYFDVLVRSSGDEMRATRLNGAAAAIAGCTAEFRLSPSDSEVLNRWRPFEAYDTLVTGPFISITIVPKPARPASCGTGMIEDLGVHAIALRFALDTIPHPSIDADMVEVYRRGERIEPLMTAKVLAMRVVPGPIIAPDGTHALKVWLRVEDVLEAQSGGSFEVRVWNELYSEPRIVVVPAEAIADIGGEFLGWRVSRLSGASFSGLPYSLPRPEGELLRAARDQYSSGDYIGSANQIVDLLGTGSLSRSDRLNARVQLGLTFAAARDDAGARFVLGGVMKDEPCLELSGDASPHLRELVDEVTPEARCVARPMIETLRAGLMPGRAQSQLQPRNVELGRSIRIGTVVLAAFSVSFHLTARAMHRNYETEATDFVQAYRDADALRQRGNDLAVATYTLWGASIVHAVLAERSHARRLGEIRPYGGTPSSARVEVRPAPRGIGLSLVFF